MDLLSVSQHAFCGLHGTIILSCFGTRIFGELQDDAGSLSEKQKGWAAAVVRCRGLPMEYQTSFKSPFAPVRPKRPKPADVQRDNEALLAFKRSLVVANEEDEAPEQGGDGEQDHPTADLSRVMPSTSSRGILKSSSAALPASDVLPALNTIHAMTQAVEDRPRTLSVQIPSRSKFRERGRLDQRSVSDGTIVTMQNNGEDLDALLGNLQKDSEVLRITILEYEDIRCRRRCFSAAKMVGIVGLIIGLAAGGRYLHGVLYPAPPAPPPPSPPPQPPPPSEPIEVLAALPLIGTGIGLAMVGTEAVHWWTSGLAHLGLLAVLALFATLGYHLGIIFGVLPPPSKSRSSTTGSQTNSFGFGTAKPKEPASAASATAARATAARAAAARAVQGRWRQAHSPSSGTHTVLLKSRVLNDMLSGVHPTPAAHVPAGVYPTRDRRPSNDSLKRVDFSG